MSASSVESRVEKQLMPATRIVGFLFLLLMAGCVGVEHMPPQTGAPQGEAVAVEPSMNRSTGQSVAKTDLPTPAEVPASPIQRPASTSEGRAKVSRQRAASEGPTPGPPGATGPSPQKNEDKQLSPAWVNKCGVYFELMCQQCSH